MNDTSHSAGNQQPHLTNNMPKLSSGVSRGVNKMAVVYVVLITASVAAMTLSITSNAFSAGDAKPKTVAFEEVVVPAKPVFRPTPAPITPEPTMPKLLEQPRLPGMVDSPPPPEQDELMMRRMANQNNLVAMQTDRNNANPFFRDEFSAVKRGAVQALANADFTLTRGTFIRCALETKVVSTQPGMASCIVTEPIYSFNGRRLLIDKGSRVTGQYNYVDEHYDRIAIVWTRILTTAGLDVRIDSAGTDALGGAGVPGIYDGHWGERIGAAMLVSLLADTIDIGSQKYAERNEIRGRETAQFDRDGRLAVVQTDPWESHTARTARRAATEMMAKSANRKATVTVLNGTIVNIFAARDVDFSSVMQ